MQTRNKLWELKAHRSWSNIRSRCYNPNATSYPRYGARGIRMSEDFRNNFIAFYNEIGDPQNETDSVDRIDPSLGYEKGNIRWASAKQQSQNKLKYLNNNSGVSGVHFYYSTGGKKVTYAVATWADSGPKNKKFNCNKLGLMPAFKMAVEFRNKMIGELNAKGAEYSAKHGNERNT